MAENDGAMTNEDLSAAYRTESNSTQLTALRKDFYVAAQQLIDSLSKECFRLMSESPDSVMYEGMVQKKKKARKRRVIRTVIIVVVLVAIALTAGVLYLRRSIARRLVSDDDVSSARADSRPSGAGA